MASPKSTQALASFAATVDPARLPDEARGKLGWLFLDHQTLRAACATGFLAFAAFGALWATLAGLLARPPFQLGADVVGLFGLIGAVSIVAGPFLGRQPGDGVVRAADLERADGLQRLRLHEHSRAVRPRGPERQQGRPRCDALQRRRGPANVLDREIGRAHV